MAVVILRGTNGSGKTHLVNGILTGLGPSTETLYFPDGKRVAGYEWPQHQVAVLGKYATACGGCDGFSWAGAADDIEAVITEATSVGLSVLLEGLTVSSWGVARLQRLVPLGLRVVQLSTPLPACIAAVVARREARAAALGQPAKPLNPANVVRKYESLQKALDTQPKVGIPIEVLDRAAAAVRVREHLGLR